MSQVRVFTTSKPVQADITAEVFNEIVENQSHPFHKLVVHEYVDDTDLYYITYNEQVKFGKGMNKNKLYLILNQ